MDFLFEAFWILFPFELGLSEFSRLSGNIFRNIIIIALPKKANISGSTSAISSYCNRLLVNNVSMYRFNNYLLRKITPRTIEIVLWQIWQFPENLMLIILY